MSDEDYAPYLQDVKVRIIYGQSLPVGTTGSCSFGHVRNGHAGNCDLADTSSGLLQRGRGGVELFPV